MVRLSRVLLGRYLEMKGELRAFLISSLRLLFLGFSTGWILKEPWGTFYGIQSGKIHPFAFQAMPIKVYTFLLFCFNFGLIMA